MAEVYVTLSEAAELEGVQYQTMARRTQRNKKNFVTKTEKSETGGRDVVLVAVSSLSKQARNAWGIKNPFFFQKKVFYWGTKEEQKEIYVLEEGETILSLNKYGDLWEAETIAIPWIHHSQEVEVQHSKYSGIVTVEKTIVRSDDTGAVHMYIYFAGGEKDV